jgi:hypothetical protein
MTDRQLRRLENAAIFGASAVRAYLTLPDSLPDARKLLIGNAARRGLKAIHAYLQARTQERMAAQ